MNQNLSGANLWTKLPSLPVRSGNFVAGTVDGNIVLAGGITWNGDTKVWMDQVWRFDETQKIWSEEGRLPCPIAYAAFGQSGRGIFFSGGSDGKTTKNGFHLLNAKLELEKVAELSQRTVYAGNAISGSKLFVVAGGSDVVDLKTLTNTFYSIDLASGTTEKLPDFPGGNLIVPTATAIGDRIFVFTGASIDSEGKAINVDSSFVYDVRDGKWERIKSYPMTVRGLASCALDDRHILLGGGYTNEFTDAAFIYDTKKDEYFKTEALPFRSMSCFIKSGEKIYWAGGEDKMRHRSDLFYVAQWKQLLRHSGAHKN